MTGPVLSVTSVQPRFLKCLAFCLHIVCVRLAAMPCLGFIVSAAVPLLVVVS